MATLRIYLGNTHRMKFNTYQVEDATWYLFNKSVQLYKKDTFNSIVVKMVEQRPSLQKTDRLVHLVPSHPKGVLGTRFGSKPKRENQYGWTAWDGNEFGAEVYVRDLTDQPWDIAKFVWHEALHIKTKEQDEMHRRGGLAGTIETGVGGSWLTAQNIKDMAEVLGVKRTIWTGGFDLTISSGPITFD
jgi:hypothetical protein